jgi:hypothetical protein
MRSLNRGSVVVALPSAAAMLVDRTRSGAAAAQLSPNPMVVAQTVQARMASALAIAAIVSSHTMDVLCF